MPIVRRRARKLDRTSKFTCIFLSWEVFALDFKGKKTFKSKNEPKVISSFIIVKEKEEIYPRNTLIIFGTCLVLLCLYSYIYLYLALLAIMSSDNSRQSTLLVRLLRHVLKWHRGYYMPARGYEFYLRVFNLISPWSNQQKAVTHSLGYTPSLALTLGLYSGFGQVQAKS